MGPLVKALLSTLMLTVVGGAYVASYIAVQAKPHPHGVPVRLAGPRAKTTAAAARLHRQAPDAYDVRIAPSVASARRAVLDGDAAGALVLGKTPSVLLAPVRGGSTSRLLMQNLAPSAGITAIVKPVLLRPLPDRDVQGTALGNALLPLVVLGVIASLFLAAIAPELTVRVRVAVLGGYSVVLGVMGGLIVTVAFDAVPTSTLATCVVLSALVAAVALPTMALVSIVGPLGVVVAFVLFLVVGNVAAGAVVDTALMPQPWRAVGPLLPPGAATDLMRGLAPHDPRGLVRPIAVLGAFIAGGLAVALAFGGRRPAPQGDPSGPTPDQHVVTGV